MICENTNPCFFDMLNGKKPFCQKGCLDKGKCQQGEMIACTDSAKTYYLGNPKHLTAAVVKIDGFVIDDKSPGCHKCDFAVLIGDSAHEPIAVLVELKGGHTGEAIQQLQGTLTTLKGTLCKFGKVYARILANKVTKGSPKATDDMKLRDLRVELRKCHGDLGYRKWRKGNDLPHDSVTVAGNGIILK